MSSDVATRNTVTSDIQEKVLIGGDLSRLTTPERLSYYKAVCESLGLNPLTRPFEYMVLEDKLVLYARKDCTDQLRARQDVDVHIVNREIIEGLCVVTARAKQNTGREDEAIGAVPLVKENGEWSTAQSGKKYFKGDGTFKPLTPEARANAMMKAETKAKRRVTLSICGLGILDEVELDTMPEARLAPDADGLTPRVPKGEELLEKLEAKERGSIVEPTVSQVMKEMGLPPTDPLSLDNPAEPYRAKLRTCERSGPVINATYHAIPEEIRQDCYQEYAAQLKSLEKKKK